MLILKYFWSRAIWYKIRFVFFLLPVDFFFWGKYFVYIQLYSEFTEKKSKHFKVLLYFAIRIFFLVNYIEVEN